MKILDCTLRDGGYCNNWEFGKDNIRKILSGLVEAKADIIECGFITNGMPHKPDISKFNMTSEVDDILPVNRGESIFVCMINYGEYDVSELPQRTEGSIDGIRVTFHKKDIAGAMEMGETIMDKGYLLFLQPMVSLSYTDEEFLGLIKQSNLIKPYAFYIVDSFGVMKQRDLIRLFYLVEHNLHKDVAIGFHSHNNMQLAYSNAQSLLNAGSLHELIIDSSIYGMGRGAGNLNTELFLEYLNDYYRAGYEIKPILNIIDEILNDFYQRACWGYSLPNYLSAKHNAHPNYAGYLEAKKTLTMDNMDNIFSMMDDEKKVSYDEKYIEKLYVQYLSSGGVFEANLSVLREQIRGKPVLIVAPGKSSIDEKEKVVGAINSGMISVSVNFYYEMAETTYVFISNLRRFRQFPKDKIGKCIVTSNVPSTDVYARVDYKDLTNTKKDVIDNAGLMLIRFMMMMGCKKVLLAGFDGYEYDSAGNFANANMRIEISKARVDAQNRGMSEILTEYSEEIEIAFLTKQKFVRIK